jgi:hypothetical protein
VFLFWHCSKFLYVAYPVHLACSLQPTKFLIIVYDFVSSGVSTTKSICSYVKPLNILNQLSPVIIINGDYKLCEWFLPINLSTIYLSKLKLSLCLNAHHTMKTYWGSGGIAPPILGLVTECMWMVSFTPRPIYPQGKIPLYPLDRRLSGPQSRSGHGGEEKSSQPPPGIEP